MTNEPLYYSDITVYFLQYFADIKNATAEISKKDLKSFKLKLKFQALENSYNQTISVYHMSNRLLGSREVPTPKEKYSKDYIWFEPKTTPLTEHSHFTVILCFI